MVTEHDIAQAQAALDDALSALGALNKPWRRLYPSPEAGAALSAAQGRVELAEKRLQDLAEEYEQQQAEIAARPGREKAAAKQLKTAVEDLKASRARVTLAAANAQAALVDLLDAAMAHNALVYQTAGELAAAGLGPLDGHECETQGAVTSGRPAVRVKGQWWPTVDAGSVAAWVVHRVALARLGRMSPLAARLFMVGQRYDLARRVDDMLAEVPEVPALDVDLPPVRVAELDGPRAFFRSEGERQQAEKDAANAYQVWEATEHGPRRIS
ncbi:hypothetical protein ABZW11_04910 [Nonomuraea sp. NPDC004580]|uniref:hypothetical protein n=1 Tax=Nonomuraea sp. NPDC004580 TaxID=3154552 RepID=UPI0033B902B7